MLGKKIIAYKPKMPPDILGLVFARMNARVSLTVAVLLFGVPLPSFAQVSEQDLSEAISYDEFLVDGSLSAAEQARICAILRHTARKDPTEAAENVRAVDQSLHRIQSDKNALDKDLVRERTWDRVDALLSSGHATPDMKAEVAVLRSSGNLVAADARTQVTRSDIIAQFASDDAIAKLAGFPVFSTEQIEAYAQSIHASFQGLPRNVQDEVVHAASRWVALRRMLADTQMRAAVLRDIRKHVRAQNDLAPQARAEETVAMRYAAIGKQEMEIARQQGRLMIPGNSLVNALTGGN